MPAPKGRPRPAGSGRMKGTPNKARELFSDLVEQEIGAPAIIEMCRRYNDCRDDNENPNRADRLLSEITSYCHAKPKAIEHSIKEGTAAAFAITPIDLDERKKQLKGEK